MIRSHCTLRPDRVLAKRDRMLYGHFIEHFHRQIYGGVYDPQSRFADADGFREDVLEAMRRIRVPVLRWPGGCFVSAYHWKNAVGPERTPMFDKAWRVEDPNRFGTDEYIKLCRKIGCEPYICTNAGSGTAEEMSDWVEYCNLTDEGAYARARARNGQTQPYAVKYWSIGNENYGHWEIGAKGADEWPRLVCEAAKMMRRVDPSAELSAAALSDAEWNLKLLERCGPYLKWISIHQYWDMMAQEHSPMSYEQVMACTADLDASIRRVRGLLCALGLEKQIRIAFDEWNLRGWHHPNIMDAYQGRTKDEYLTPRDLNDINATYTMADAVFTASFLNTLNRNCDIVGMANFSPIVNTTGCIFTHPGGLVLRSTYHVFDLYMNQLGDELLDGWTDDAGRMDCAARGGAPARTDALDVLFTRVSGDDTLAVAAVNRRPDEAAELTFAFEGAQTPREYRISTVNGDSPDAYNDIGSERVTLRRGEWTPFAPDGAVRLEPHSVNVIAFR